MKQFTIRSSAARVAATALDVKVRACASTSFSANLFHGKIVGKELFPFPIRKFTTEEGENMETLVRHVQEKKLATTSSLFVEWNAAGSPIASEYGGLELSETAHAVVLEEFARNAPAASYLPLLRHLGPCTYLIKAFANKELKARYLSAMSDASMRMAWAPMEPHAGMDFSMNQAVATAHEDGSYTITGTKLVLEGSHAGSAASSSFTHLLVMAKAPVQSTGADGNPIIVQKATFFIVDRNAKGVRVEAAPASYTSNGSKPAVVPQLVHLDGALALDMVGTAGEGHVQNMVTIHSTHHLLSAVLTGLGKRALNIAMRSVASTPAASSGVLHALLASSAADMYAMEAALFALAGSLDSQAPDSLIEATTTAALIATTVPAMVQRIVDAFSNVEVGGNAELRVVLEELDAALSLGAPETFLNACGASCGVEDYGMYFQKSSTLETMQNRTLRSIGIRDRIPAPQATTWAECKLIEEAVVAFVTAVEQVFVRNNVRLRFQPLLLDRIGEASALLYASTAAVSRVLMAESKGVESSKVEKKLASVYIQRAMARVTELTDECRNTGKTADEAYKRIAAEQCDAAFRAAGGIFVPPPPPAPPQPAVDPAKPAEASQAGNPTA